MNCIMESKITVNVVERAILLLISKLMTSTILVKFLIYIQGVAKIHSQLKTYSLQFVPGTP